MVRSVLTAAAVSVAMLGTAVAVAPAFADDRPANAREERRIANVLRANGYVSWGKIELERDDGSAHWEVDDARRRDGSKWDLKLRPQSLRIFARDRDD